MMLTPEQSIAARALLKWKAKDLSEKIKIDYATVSAFERGARDLRMSNLKSFIDAFNEAGIEFIENKDQIGVILNKK